MTANDNTTSLAAAVATKHLRAQITECQAEALSMAVLLKRNQELIDIGDGFREEKTMLGAVIADKLYEAGKIIADAIIEIGNDIDEKQKRGAMERASENLS